MEIVMILVNDNRPYRSTRKIKSIIAMAKTTFPEKKVLFANKLGMNLRRKLVKYYIWRIALYGAENLTLRKVYQKYQEGFEMWCCRRMEKIGWPIV